MTTPPDPFGRPEGSVPPGRPGVPPPGFPQPGHPVGPPVPSGTNGLAIASLIVSLACCGPLGLVLGLVALNKIKQTGQDGRGLALAGVWVGVATTTLGVVLLLTGTLDFNTTVTQCEMVTLDDGQTVERCREV